MRAAAWPELASRAPCAGASDSICGEVSENRRGILVGGVPFKGILVYLGCSIRGTPSLGDTRMTVLGGSWVGITGVLRKVAVL